MELRIVIRDGLLDLTPPRNRRRIMKVMASYGRPTALLGVGRREVRRVLMPCARAWPPYARTRCQPSARRILPRCSACSRAPERPRRTPPGGVGANPPLFTSEAPVILAAGAALPTRPGQLGLRRRRDSPMQIRPQGDPPRDCPCSIQKCMLCNIQFNEVQMCPTSAASAIPSPSPPAPLFVRSCNRFPHPIHNMSEPSAANSTDVVYNAALPPYVAPHYLPSIGAATWILHVSTSRIS